MGETEGTCSKRRKKTDDNARVLQAQKHEHVTCSKTAIDRSSSVDTINTVQNQDQLEWARAAKCRRRKRRKKTDDDRDDDVLLAQMMKNIRTTRSKAANDRSSSVGLISNDVTTVQNQDQLELALSAERQSQTHHEDLESVCIAAGEIRKVNGTEEVSSYNPPKLFASKSFIQKSDSHSRNKDKQAAEKFVDEKISHGNQGNSFTDVRSFRSHQKKADHKIELHYEFQPRSLTIPSCTQLIENVLPSATEKTRLYKSHSLNLTEIAANMADHSFLDEEQAESSIAPIRNHVDGYQVKKEVAPMLQQIFHKHNDIAKDCIIKNREIIVPILEVICSYCQKLENTYLKDVMDTEIQDMTLVVENFQQMGFDVKWFIERLKDVYEMKRLLKGCPTLKEEQKKVGQKQKEVEMLKQKWCDAEAEFAAMKGDVDEKNREFYRQIKALKVKGLPFWNKPLLYGLI